MLVRHVVSLRKITDVSTADGSVVNGGVKIPNVAWRWIIHGRANTEIIRSALNTSVEFLNDACFLLKASDLIGAAYDCAITH